MQTNIYFVRHAHSTYTPDELGRPLSDKGFSDAKKVTRALQDDGIDIIISSPYKRAIQTVEGLAKQNNTQIIIEEGFKERILASESVEDFDKAITKVWENPSFAWEGGESNHTAQERGVHALNQVLEKYEGQKIVIGTHGNIMVLMMNYFNENYGFDFWRALQMPDIYKLTFHMNEFMKIKQINIDE